MDCALVSTGASLYLTVGIEGALFGCGDMHAAMGDGEVVICGAETPGYARVRAQVVPIPGLPTPFIENDEVVAVIASAETVDMAKDLAIHGMLDFLTGVAGLPLNAHEPDGRAQVLSGRGSAHDSTLRVSKVGAQGVRLRDATPAGG